MKIFINQANENWIIDRFYQEFTSNMPGTLELVDSPLEADIIWLIAAWTWDQIPRNVLENKFVIASINHIDPDKFDRRSFRMRDQVVDAYQVPCAQTFDMLRPLTKKLIMKLPYWSNTELWTRTRSREEAKAQFLHNRKIQDEDTLLVGSFQRDTEGFDLASPKLSKGPDLLVNYLSSLLRERPIHAVLCGWRRQYVINCLKSLGIPYTYFEMPDLRFIRRMYEAIDIYPITSRVEGGPQAVIECGLMETPCIGHDVGSVASVLAPESVCPIGGDLSSLTPNLSHAYAKAQALSLDRMAYRYASNFEEAYNFVLE
jgi:hypothetical protein